MKSEFFYFHNIAPIIVIISEKKNNTNQKHSSDSLQRLWVSAHVSTFSLPYMGGYLQPMFLYQRSTELPFAPGKPNQGGTGGNFRDCKGCPAKGNLTRDTHPEQIIFIWVFSKKIDRDSGIPQNGSWFINNGKLLLLGTPFFSETHHYTKIIPKPQVLEHFGVASLTITIWSDQ